VEHLVGCMDTAGGALSGGVFRGTPINVRSCNNFVTQADCDRWSQHDNDRYTRFSFCLRE